jgi:hypothetical protein
MNEAPITEAEFDLVMRLLAESLAGQIKAYRILARFRSAGLHEADDGTIRRYDDDLARMRQNIAKTNERRRKLKQSIARKREIDAERKRLRSS